MKTLFIPVKLNFEININRIKKLSKKLPKSIAIAYSVQYENQAKEIKKILQKKHKITKFIQILGCSKLSPPKNTKAILLISDGDFHAISLAYETKLPTFLFNNKLTKIYDKEIDDIEKRNKISYIRFLNSENVGVLISTKFGQEKLKEALNIKNKIKNKKSYFFISNNINTAEFENFPQIGSWINTACPRLDMEDNRIINIDRIN